MSDPVLARATEVGVPPAWAVTQRRLMETMEQAADLMLQKYTEPSGTLYFADDVDDLYERFFNWGLFYAIGGHDRMLDHALKQWNAVTRWCDDGVQNRLEHNEFLKDYGGGKTLRRNFNAQIHNEYYNLAEPASAEWHHKGEGNMAFYDFGVACPAISENLRRARRFAAMYTGEDPEAPNFDPAHNVFRSPFQSSVGPWLETDNVEMVKFFLQGGHPGTNMEWVPEPMGDRASLYPAVRDLEAGWFESPKRREEIIRLFNSVVLQSDIANNLSATALVTNAYLYTGEESYRKWVLDYVDAWMDRIRQNNGIVPDNVGPTGKIGERREGVWWGGVYGWNSSYGLRMIFHSLTIAAECALLLSGDFGYLELLRSQIEMVLANAKRGEDGQLLVPWRVGEGGWDMYKPVRIREPVHLWHASMAPRDHELITRLRAGDIQCDWNQVIPEGEKNEGATERPRFQFYNGENPDWPEQIMTAEYRLALEALQAIRADSRDVFTIIADNIQPPNPVYTKGLTQVTLGAPQSVYNGGLLRAQVRYFDEERRRPGLPHNVAALVDRLSADGIGIHLVNLDETHTRRLFVQAGAFGEHDFTELRYDEVTRENLQSIIWNNGRHDIKETRHERREAIDGTTFAVELPPRTHIKLDAGMRRFVNRPSYAFPWDNGRVLVPFQRPGRPLPS